MGYAVRIIAVNDIGDGPPSDEATGTPRETTPPELSTATVDGATLTLTYDEDLDENSEPSPDATATRPAPCATNWKGKAGISTTFGREASTQPFKT